VYRWRVTILALSVCEANQLRALRDGYSPAITADPAKLEHQLAGIQARLKTSDPRTVKLQIRDTWRFVESRLEDLSALWDGEPRIAREEIAKHVGKITLETDASHVHLYRSLRLARSTGNRGCYGGAGGPARTDRNIRFTIKVAA